MTEQLRKASPELIESDLRGFQVYRGLDGASASQLVLKSRQRLIKKWTPKDAAERFKDEDSLAAWQSQDRKVYALQNEGDLGGVIWYGEKPFPLRITPPQAPHHTFAIRLYNNYRGKHLAQPFMDSTLRSYLTVLDSRGELNDFHGLWLSTSHDNNARCLYGEYGYKEVAFKDGEVIMVLPVQTIAERIKGA